MRDKVLVRRLPPQLPETIFWSSVEPICGPGKIKWKKYVCGKKSKNQYSRAYLQFSDAESLLHFFQSFDNHVFIDAKGTEYRCLIEFAPYQSVPGDIHSSSNQKNKKNGSNETLKQSASVSRKPDSRQGTIASDPEYQKFLQELESKNINIDGANHEQIIEFLSGFTVTQEETPITAAPTDNSKTPLLEFLRQKPKSSNNKISASSNRRSASALPQSSSSSNPASGPSNPRSANNANSTPKPSKSMPSKKKQKRKGPSSQQKKQQNSSTSASNHQKPPPSSEHE